MMKQKAQRKAANKVVRKFPPTEDLNFPNKATLRNSRSKGLGTSLHGNSSHVRPLQRHGSIACIQPIVSQTEQKELGQLAVSVHYLQTQFLKEVRRARFSRDDPIYVIENLRGPPGVIRRKGKNVTCPVDGKLGAAYVHCIQGEDNVGKATHMLSYSWSYTIGDVVDTLNSFCESHDQDPKRTFVWICCLCVNQHRVVQQTEAGQTGIMDTEALDFFSLFGERVTEIGTIIAMMAPWESPTYLTRVWCIFELYTAHQKGCQIVIAMPPAQTKAFEEDVVGGDKSEGIDKLYEVLAKTRVQDAKASVETDRVSILAIVNRSPGYAALNNRVNELLRNWVRGVIAGLATRVEGYHAKKSSALWVRTAGIFIRDIPNNLDLNYANFCCRVGKMLHNNEENEAATKSVETSLKIYERIKGNRDPHTATVYGLHGDVLFAKGDYESALQAYQKSRYIRQEVLGQNHMDTAEAHRQVGSALEAQADYSGALAEYQRSLEILESQPDDKTGEELEELEVAISESYGSIASVLEEKGEIDKALDACRKALVIRERVIGPYPATAKLYSVMSTLLFYRKDYVGALRESRKALVIEENILGKNHTDTACSYVNVGMCLKRTGDLDGALVEYKKALKIVETVLGVHPSTARAHNNIGAIQHEQGKYDEAVESYRKALAIKESMLGERHPDTATTYNNIGLVLSDKGDHSNSLDNLYKALNILEAAFGKRHFKLVPTYNNIGGALQAKWDFEGALDALRTSLEITEAHLGKNCPEAEVLLARIYVLLRITAK